MPRPGSTLLTLALTATTLASCKTEGAKTGEASAAAVAAPDVQTRELDYQVGNTRLHGFVAWDANAPGKRPGVLVVHEWWGLNDHARHQARRLAEAGYVGFALDMYGDGKVTVHPDSAQAFAQEATKDPAVVAARFNAALDQLKRDPHVDSTRVAAIGYCFGGAVVLGMARAGADLAAVATFHGALAGLGPVDSGAVKARILVQTGGADPFVPAEQVESFRKEMEAAGADVQVITYPGVKHSFTNPHADSVGMSQLGYDAQADQQSWAAMLKLFQQVFPE